MNDPEIEAFSKAVQNGVEEHFDDPDQPIPECGIRDCDTVFIGVTARDYAAHLVEEHEYFQNSIELGDWRGIYQTVARAMIE